MWQKFDRGEGKRCRRVRGDNGYIVAPPSVHACGGTYEWQSEFSFAAMPPWLIKIVGNGASRTRAGGGGADDAQPVGDDTASSPLRISKGARNATLTSIGGTLRAKGLSEEAIRVALLQLNSEQDDPLPMDEVEQVVSIVSRYPDGSGEFQADEGGRPYKNQHNVRVSIARLGHRLRYDRFADRQLIDGEHFDDARKTRLWLEIDERFKLRPAEGFFWKVVEDLARQDSFHPVVEYLDALSWDGVPRIDSWLRTYLGVEDDGYAGAVGALWLVAAVRRVRNPGCKFDEMLVLESDQGQAKSSALETIAVHDSWFSDALNLGADSNRQIEALQGKWIIEAPELKGMRNGDVESLKAFLSRRVDRGRLAYARSVAEYPRQCVIAGSTNGARYLKDGTGNRRFWPVRTGAIDLPALRRDRDQLWAEAAAREATGASIRLATDLWQIAAKEQEARKVDDPVVDRLASALGGFQGRIKVADVWALLGYDTRPASPLEGQRLADAMAELGWTRKDAKFDGRTFKAFVRGDDAEVLEVLVDDHRRATVTAASGRPF